MLGLFAFALCTTFALSLELVGESRSERDLTSASARSLLRSSRHSLHGRAPVEFSLLCPSRVRAGRRSRLGLAFYKLPAEPSGPVVVQLRDRGRAVVAQQTFAAVADQRSLELFIDTPLLTPPGDYELHVYSESGVIGSADVQVVPNSLVLSVFTDVPFYETGQKAQLAAFVVDEDGLVPPYVSACEFQVLSPSLLPVFQETVSMGPSGLGATTWEVSGERGSYKLQVECQNATLRQVASFDVVAAARQPFSVSMSVSGPDPYVVPRSRELAIDVTARYPWGESVVGAVDLKLFIALDEQGSYARRRSEHL